MKNTTLKPFIVFLKTTLLLLFFLTADELCNAQTEIKESELRKFIEPNIEDYEQMVLESSQALLSNPINEKSADFVSACKIVTFWMHQDTGFGIPLGGNFYYKLTNSDNQQYFYAVSIVNYLLDQKINHNRILNCLPSPDSNYRHQEDVQEVRLKAAEIFLKYAKKSKNKLKLTVRTRKYLKFYRRGTLHEKFAEELDELPTKKQVNSPFITYFRPK